MGLVPVFDLDGTLLDSDRALIAPFVALGVDRDQVGFGMTLQEACDDLGVSVQDYLDRYEPGDVQPFPGVQELIDQLGRWAIFSNKLEAAGHRDLRLFGWEPELASFVKPGGGPKSLMPVLENLKLSATEIVCVGDSDHDRRCARAVGSTFALAGWNARATAVEGDVILDHPHELLPLLRG